MAENSSGYVTDPATTGKLPVVAADAAPGKGPQALLDHLEDLVDELPHMQARSDRLALARAAEKVAACHRAKLTADAELAEADRLVAEAERELLRITSPLAAVAGRADDPAAGAAPTTSVPDAVFSPDNGVSETAASARPAEAAKPQMSSQLDEDALDEAIHAAQERVLHAGLMRGMRTGPANNAAAELDAALEASPFQTVEEALAAVLSEEACAQLEEQISQYQLDYNQTLAACQSAEKTGCFKAV